jgi:hypothetical protein
MADHLTHHRPARGGTAVTGAIAIACTVLLGSAGCGSAGSGATAAAAPSSATSSAPRTAAPAGGGKPDCSLAPASMVGAALGVDIKDGPTAMSNTLVTECSYTTPAFDDVTIRFETQENAQGFALGKQGFGAAKVTDVAGFQDEAYYNAIGIGVGTITTLVARKGAVEIEVSSKAPLDREKALETQLFAALG